MRKIRPLERGPAVQSAKIGCKRLIKNLVFHQEGSILRLSIENPVSNLLNISGSFFNQGEEQMNKPLIFAHKSTGLQEICTGYMAIMNG
jgi:hypothetical protein